MPSIRMSAIFGILFLASLIALVIGLIRPRIFRNRKTGVAPSRKKIAAITTLLAFVFFILLAITVPPSNRKANVQSDVETKKPSTVVAQPSVKPTAKPAHKPTSSPTSTPKPISKPNLSVLEKIEKIVSDKYSNFEVTVWNRNSELASEGQTPYEVVLNGSFNKTIVSDCKGAKNLSYYMLETLFKDNEIRPTLSRVMITIPYYLRVSLGASDGVPMVEKGSFSGPTNFWKVMEQMGLGENENGEMKNRTWGAYLTKCE